VADSSDLREIERRLDVLAEQIFYLVQKASTQNVEDIRAIRRNQVSIEKHIGKMAAISAKNQLAVEKTVMNALLDYFDHVPPAIEAFVLKAARDTAQEKPSSQGNSMNAGSSTVKCSRCSAEIGAHDRFCCRCGHPNTVQQAHQA
jgi:hypothetical protein